MFDAGAGWVVVIGCNRGLGLVILLWWFGVLVVVAPDENCCLPSEAWNC